MTSDNKLYDTFYVARQPILDRDLNTFGYELLYRKGAGHTTAIIEDPEWATVCVATCGFIKSQESLNQSKRIFINFTEQLIIQGAPRAMPPSVTVVEILEDILPSPELLDEIIKLKQDGYLIAIDDFDGCTGKETLLNLADIIKIDVLNKSEQEITEIFQNVAQRNVIKLAEKVDSKELYEFLHDLGFDFYQGFFFAMPEQLSGKKLKGSTIHKLRIMAKLNDPSLDTEKLVALINGDPSITYRLLRFMNSAAFGFSMKIESVRHAIALLGSRRLTYWLRMVVFSDLTDKNTPDELFILALNRAKTLEEMAIDKHCGNYEPDSLFLFGMLSLIDVMLDTDFETVLNVLPLPLEFQRAYLAQEGALKPYLSILRNIERDNLQALETVAGELGIAVPHIYNAHLRAINWTEDIFSELL